jgi:GT2 family glycosyltransferase
MVYDILFGLGTAYSYRILVLTLNPGSNTKRTLMGPSPFVSIILLNYNGLAYIRNCVYSVLKSDYTNFELIIVDNNSTDKSIDIIESDYNDDRIKIVRNDKNLGFAGGNNLGAQYAKGRYLALLNIDTIVDSQWLTELVRLMEYDSSVGIAQPKLLSLSNKSIYDSAGDYIDFFGNCFRLGGGWEEKDVGQYDTIHEIFSARGAALLTRKEIVENIGLFDEDFFMNFEDIDFSWRVRLNGKRVVFVPRSIVYHKGHGIISKAPLNSSYLEMHNFKNIKTSMIKNYNFIHMVKYAALPLVAELITCFFLVEPYITQPENKSARIRGKLKGYFWILANANRLRKKRLHIQRNIRRVPDSQVMKYMLGTSIWHLLTWAFNVKKFGYGKARMLYVAGGMSRIIPLIYKSEGENEEAKYNA